jgi:hypothetical protein
MCQKCQQESSRRASQHMGAVRARQEQTAYIQPQPQPRRRPHPVANPPFALPPFDRYRNISYRQTHHQHTIQQFPTSHAASGFYTMAMQPNESNDGAWKTQRDRDMGGQLAPDFAPQPRIVHAQSGHPVQGPSFFEDCLSYRPEEEALYNPMHRYPVQNNITRSMDVLTMPFAPTNFPSPSNDITVGQKVELQNDVPIMPLVQTNVDTAQFDPVKCDDWRKASIDMGLTDDEFATSPESSNDTSYGPFTPTGDDKRFADFASRSFSTNLSSSFDNSGAGMFGDLGDLSCHLNFSPVGNPGSSIGSQFGSQGSHFAGLPSEGSRFGELPLNQGAFRGIDRLPPTLPAVPQGSHEHGGSGTSRVTTKIKRRRSSEREEKAISRDEKDQYLLDRREEGYTYKEIKVMGSFSEAESTLRGRVRVLTKDRCDRVRKPVWTDRDVCIDPDRLPKSYANS